MLSARDLELIRTQQEENLPDVCTISRRVLADDGFGGVTETNRTVVATDVPVRITPAQMFEGFGNRATPLEINVYTVRLPRDTTIRDEDYLQFADGSEFQVERVHRPRSRESVLTCTAERIL